MNHTDEVRDLVIPVVAADPRGFGQDPEPVVVPDRACAHTGEPGDLAYSHNPIINVVTVTRSKITWRE